MSKAACCALLFLLAPPRYEASAQPLQLLDVPYISQSEALCGGAAAAMVLRYWGTQGLTAESFAHLVDRSAAGIRTNVLVSEIQSRGFTAAGVEATSDQLGGEIRAGRPVIALIEDRPGTFHYIVIVGWHARGVVFHDPARAPYQVMRIDEFMRRWERSRRWMLVLTPPGGPEGPQLRTPSGGPAGPQLRASTACEALIDDGVREAQAGRLEAAEQRLTAAISCSEGAAYRELAGVRLMQRRWPEVITLASAAVEQDANDTYAWKLLATARFISNEANAALDAWNRAGEPRVDLIRVEGLRRTRQRVLEDLLDIRIGDLLTTTALSKAGRRLQDLPSVSATGVSYVPRPNGVAELRAAVVERSAYPRSPIELAALGVRAIVARELSASFASPTGGGERFLAAWRFWPGRPRYALALEAPGRAGLIWQVSGSVERQPFTDPVVPIAERAAGVLSFGRWETGALRWSLAGGFERWRDRGRFGVAGGTVRVAPSAHVDVSADWRTWMGTEPFSSSSALFAVRSTAAREGLVFAGRGAAEAVSVHAPADLWRAGDNGQARPVLLRAHPVIDDGHLRSNRLGRRIVGGTVELQWWQRRGLLQWAPAMFVDVARTSSLLSGPSLTDTDTGVGLRLSIPGLTGNVRVDVARGLRDGATALSLVYEP